MDKPVTPTDLARSQMAEIPPLNSTPSSPEIPPPNELIAQLLEALKTARRLLSQVDPGDPALDGCYTEIDAAEIDDAIDAAANTSRQVWINGRYV